MSEFDSGNYWRKRYRRGQTSGAGSYGTLAEYKANYINKLVMERSIGSVIEFGSGDGNQAALFNFPNFTGIDVSKKVVGECRARFADRDGWAFFDAESVPKGKRDLSMSLDVIYHLIEDDVFDGYMARLFEIASGYVLIYASDYDAAGPAAHVRHRCFSDWVAKNQPDWILLDAPKHPFPMIEGSDPTKTSFASFKLFGKSP